MRKSRRFGGISEVTSSGMDITAPHEDGMSWQNLKPARSVSDSTGFWVEKMVLDFIVCFPAERGGGGSKRSSRRRKVPVLAASSRFCIRDKGSLGGVP